MNNYERIKNMDIDEMAKTFINFSFLYFEPVIQEFAKKISGNFSIEPSLEEQLNYVKQWLLLECQK